MPWTCQNVLNDLVMIAIIMMVLIMVCTQFQEVAANGCFSWYFKLNKINLFTRINFYLISNMYLWLAVSKTYCYAINNFMLPLMIIFHIRKLAEVLLIENYHISLPEACILDYYVAGFWYPLSFCIESEKVCSL